jgi:hypothetical protein
MVAKHILIAYSTGDWHRPFFRRRDVDRLKRATSLERHTWGAEMCAESN